MKRTTTFAAFVLLAVVLAPTAFGQVVAYHHRSTVWGDTYAGAAELVRAQGAFLRDEATAAEGWVRVAAAQDDLAYQRAERRYQVKQMELNYQQAKLDAKLQRREAEAAEEQAAAVEMLARAQRGTNRWPVAMVRPEYASSTTLIDSILRNWRPTDDASDYSYRRALATEAALLRARIQADARIKVSSRLEAIEAIDRVQLLANMTEQAAVNAQMAMR
jgi:hypothetical protein